jgi:Clp protease
MSLGALLLAAGAKGKRMALPNAKILIHQLSGGFEGQASDIEIQARETIAVKRRIEEIVAQHSGQPLEKDSKDMERNYFMTAEEAMETASSTRCSRAASSPMHDWPCSCLRRGPHGQAWLSRPGPSTNRAPGYG